ncbi:MAG: protein kinase domain-containing protein [Phycisphaerales bacterium]
MTPDRTADRDRFARAEDLFHRALQLDEPDRARLVDQTPDPAVRDEAVRMLRGHQRAIRSATFIEPPTAFAEPADPFGTPERWVGRTLGRYTLRTLIGTGGMGSVYEADSAFPERKVAVKVVRAAALDTAAQRRFEHEARVLARLQHPGIAQVYEAAIHEDDSARVAFIALELVPGARPLTAWTKQVAASDIPRR